MTLEMLRGIFKSIVFPWPHDCGIVSPYNPFFKIERVFFLLAPILIVVGLYIVYKKWLRNRFFKTTSLLIIIAIIILGGWLFLFYDIYIKEARNLYEKEYELSKINITDWKIYKNDNYGIEMLFPSNWTYREIPAREASTTYPDSPHEFVKIKTDYEVSFSLDRETAALNQRGYIEPISFSIFEGNSKKLKERENRIRGGKYPDYLSGEKISLKNGAGALKVVHDFREIGGCVTYAETKIYIEKNNRVYSIALRDGKNREATLFQDTFWKMANSIKFY